ncbi:MAG: MFS transporter [Anaerolineae bacterium]|nr:MFS transporter [Anaerolineae bacterium]
MTAVAPSVPVKRRRYLMFGLLYFAQGSILSYFTALNALYLLSFNLSMAQIGLFGMIALTPFILKIFLGMVSDRFNLLGRGHRLPYIVIGLLMQAVGLVIVPFLNPATQFGLFAGLAFLIMTGMALYDTCTDGFALDITSEADQGRVQGIMVGGRAAGVVVVSAAIGALAQLASWQIAFWALALVTLLPLPLVLTAREPARSPERRFQWAAFRSFGKWPVVALGLLGALYSFIINGANQLVNPYLQDSYGITLIVAGFYTAAWGVGVIIGGWDGGRRADRLGHKRAMQGAVIGGLAAIAALALINSAAIAWPLLIAFGFAFGFYEAVYFASAMRYADPRIAASMFAIFMAIANLGTGVGLAVSGSLSDAVGFQVTFLILAGLNLLAFPLLNAIFPKQPAR